MIDKCFVSYRQYFSQILSVACKQSIIQHCCFCCEFLQAYLYERQVVCNKNHTFVLSLFLNFTLISCESACLFARIFSVHGCTEAHMPFSLGLPRLSYCVSVGSSFRGLNIALTLKSLKITRPYPSQNLYNRFDSVFFRSFTHQTYKKHVNSKQKVYWITPYSWYAILRISRFQLRTFIAGSTELHGQ